MGSEWLRSLFGFGPVVSNRPAPQPVALRLSPHDVVTLGDACEGCLVLGATGSGKTSGPGFHLACNLLLQGCGFLVLCAKPDEAARWLHLCEITGRTDDVILWGPSHPAKLDVLRYALSTGSVDAAAHLLAQLVELSARVSGKGGDKEPFFTISANETLKALMTVHHAATGPHSAIDLLAMVNTLPPTAAAVHDPGWQGGSYFWTRLQEAERNAGGRTDYLLAKARILRQHAGLGDRTRSVIDLMMLNTLSQLLSGQFADILSSGESTVTPDDVLTRRKILIVDAPVLTHKEPGRFANVCWKISLQRQALARTVGGDTPHAVLWADEGQMFALEQDAMVQAVARSQRLISVLITQNLPVFATALGGGEMMTEVQALLGNYQNKVFAQNTCAVSNEFASGLIGMELQMLMNGSRQAGEYSLFDDLTGKPSQASHGFSSQWLPEVQPVRFTRLLKGGIVNRRVVTAIVHCGRVFSNGRTWIETAFLQEGA